MKAFLLYGYEPPSSIHVMAFVVNMVVFNVMRPHSLGLANLWHAAFTAVPIFFFISFARPASLYCEIYVYLNTHLIAYRLCMNYRRYQIIQRVKHFYTNLERCELLTGYLSLGRRPGGD